MRRSMKKKGTSITEKNGEKLSSQIEKMSKSKLNGINPLEIIDEYGADALRLYSMFMSPLEKEKVFVRQSINGCYRLLAKFHDIAHSGKLSDVESESAAKISHRLVKCIADDIENFQFNTAISKLMIFVNDFSKLQELPKKDFKMAIQCLYPFAPHLAYELWKSWGSPLSLHWSRSHSLTLSI